METGIRSYPKTKSRQH